MHRNITEKTSLSYQIMQKMKNGNESRVYKYSGILQKLGLQDEDLNATVENG